MIPAALAVIGFALLSGVGSREGHADGLADGACAEDADCVCGLTEQVGVCVERECLLMGEADATLLRWGFDDEEVTRTFQDLGDGTVRDGRTGLVWQKGWGGTRTWRPAMAYCARNEGGLPGSGWRLPSVDELRSLILGCPGTEAGGRCAITDLTPGASYSFTFCKACPEHYLVSYCSEVFVPHAAWFWSSTDAETWEGGEPRRTRAWDVDFQTGHVHPGPKATDIGGVRCVRGPDPARP